MKKKSKKWLGLLVLMPLIIATYYGCKKETEDLSTTKNGLVNIQAVKKLFNAGHIQEKLTENMKGIGEIVWVPDWKTATAKVRDSTTYTYLRLLPVSKNASSKLKIYSDNFKQYLILKNGEEFQRAIYIQKTDEKTRPSDHFSFSHFNGTLILHDLKTGQKNSYGFIDGQFVRKITGVNKLATINRPPTTMHWEQECTTVYYCKFTAFCGNSLLIHYDDSGDCAPPWYPPSYLEGTGCFDDFWNHSESDAVLKCENVWVNDPPPNPDEDGDGGGDEQMVNLTYEVTDSLEDPCKKNALTEISDTTVKNFITGFYNNFLVPKQGNIDLLIREANNLTVGGQAVPAYSVNTTPIPSAGSPAPTQHTWEITLSGNYFSGTGYHVSSEAWGLIIAHEILHIVINEKGLSTLVGNNDHLVMFANFVEPTKNLLHDAFGISESDALKLALNGMKDLWSFSDFAELCMTKYGVSLAEINATYDSYTKGIGGTKCD